MKFPPDLVWIRFDVSLADLGGVMRIFQDGYMHFYGGTYAVGMIIGEYPGKQENESEAES